MAAENLITQSRLGEYSLLRPSVSINPETGTVEIVADIGAGFRPYSVGGLDQPNGMMNLEGSCSCVRSVPIGADERILLTDGGGTGLNQVILFSKQVPTALTGASDIASFNSACVVREKDSIALSSNARDKSCFDIELLNFRFRAREAIICDGKINRVSCLSRDLRYIGYSQEANNALHVPLIVDRVRSRLIRCFGSDWSGIGRIQCFDAGSERALIIGTNGEFQSLFEIDLNSLDVRMLLRVAGDVERACYAADKLLVVWNDGGISRLLIAQFKSESTPVFRHITIPEGLIANMAVSENGHSVAWIQRTSAFPNDLYMMSMLGNELSARCIAQLGPASHIRERLVKPSSHSFLSSTGHCIQYWIYSKEPKICAGKSFIIKLHGGPEYQDRAAYSEVIQSLVLKGFVVVVPNIGGSTGFGLTYQSLIYGEWGRGDVRDVLDLLAHLAKQFGTTSFGLEGASYGGFLALAVASRTNVSIRSVVARWPLYDLAAYMDSAPRAWLPTLRMSLGDTRLEHVREELTSRSPISALENFRSNLLLLHGRLDGRIPVRHTEQAAELMRKHGLPVEVIYFEKEGHGGFSKLSRSLAENAELNFFERTLK